MRVAVDAMGGDHAPDVNIDGAIEAIKSQDGISVILVGDEARIREKLASRNFQSPRLSIFHASEVVDMDEPPANAVRKKKDSSLRRAIDLVKDGQADAAVSAGNSGAMMAMALFVLGRAEGVDRPAFATFMPTMDKPFLLLDAGANVDCTTTNMLQFALMGNEYSRLVVGIDRPRVALLSNGEEASKGNQLIKESAKLIAKTDLNFTGNVEPKDAFYGGADVVVCDGFIGNIFLKTSEGLAEFVMKFLKREMKGSLMSKVGSIFLYPVLKRVKRKTAYDEYGGAPLLGIKGACIVCHGRSTPKAIMNAIRIASEFASKKVYEAISKDIERFGKIGVENA